MENNKSDTLSQRKKAQEEFLKLKQMQQGKIAPEETTEEISPKTFKEKAINFWFHYKVHSIFAICLTVILAIGITQCAKLEKYDARIALYTKNNYTEEHIAIYREYLTPYFTDVDGNGKVSIQIIDCSYRTDDTFDLNYTTSLATRLQSVISTESDVQLFIITPESLKELNSVSETLPEFFVSTAEFDSGIYDTAKELGVDMPEGLMLGRRAIKGTLIENKQNIDIYVEQAKKVIEEFKK